MGFIVAMGAIGASVIAGERAWVWVVHRLEEGASRDTSWAYTRFLPNRTQED